MELQMMWLHEPVLNPCTTIDSFPSFLQLPSFTWLKPWNLIVNEASDANCHFQPSDWWQRKDTVSRQGLGTARIQIGMFEQTSSSFRAWPTFIIIKLIRTVCFEMFTRPVCLEMFTGHFSTLDDECLAEKGWTHKSLSRNTRSSFLFPHKDRIPPPPPPCAAFFSSSLSTKVSVVFITLLL